MLGLVDLTANLEGQPSHFPDQTKAAPSRIDVCYGDPTTIIRSEAPYGPLPLGPTGNRPLQIRRTIPNPLAAPEDADQGLPPPLKMPPLHDKQAWSQYQTAIDCARHGKPDPTDQLTAMRTAAVGCGYQQLPPPPFCVSLFSSAPLGAVCRVLCCAVCPWVQCGAALRRVVPSGVVLFCAVLFCCARLVPLLVVPCPVVLPVALGPCALRRCVLRFPPALCALCCVCFVVACWCALLFAAVRCAVCVLGCCAVRSLSSPLCAALCVAVLVGGSNHQGAANGQAGNTNEARVQGETRSGKPTKQTTHSDKTCGIRGRKPEKAGDNGAQKGKGREKNKGTQRRRRRP